MLFTNAFKTAKKYKPSIICHNKLYSLGYLLLSSRSCMKEFYNSIWVPTLRIPEALSLLYPTSEEDAARPLALLLDNISQSSTGYRKTWCIKKVSMRYRTGTENVCWERVWNRCYRISKETFFPFNLHRRTKHNFPRLTPVFWKHSTEFMIVWSIQNVH